MSDVQRLQLKSSIRVKLNVICSYVYTSVSKAFKSFLMLSIYENQYLDLLGPLSESSTIEKDFI